MLLYKTRHHNLNIAPLFDKNDNIFWNGNGHRMNIILTNVEYMGHTLQKIPSLSLVHELSFKSKAKYKENHINTTTNQ